MSITQTATSRTILEIGEGNQHEGYPAVLWIEKNGIVVEKVKGLLPPELIVFEKHKCWQSSYYDHHRGLGCYRRPQLVEGESTNISIIDSSQDLDHSINEWLDHSGDSKFQKIRDKLVAVLAINEQNQFIIQTDHIQHWRYHWHLWNIVNKNLNVEVTLSLSEYSKRDNSSIKRQQVRILVILGDSTGIDIEQDLKVIREKLPLAYIEAISNPNKTELRNKLWDEEGWGILFFAGHSFSEAKNGQGFFYISKEELLTIEELQESLKHAIERGLKLAIFNSCDGSGLARALADLQIPATIVMKERVPDPVAQKFVEYFLNVFVEKGKTLSSSVREVRRRLNEELDDKYPCASWLPQVSCNPAVAELTWQGLLGQSSDSGEDTQTPTVSQSENKEPVGAASIKIALEVPVSALDWLFNCFIKYKFRLVLSVLILTFIIGPSLSYGFNKIGLIYRNYQQLQPALISYKIALFFYPNNDAAINNIGDIQEDLQYFKDAANSYDLACKKGNTDACMNKAHLSLSQKKETKSNEEIVNLLITASKTTTNKKIQYASYKNQGWALLKQGKYDEAAPLLISAIELEPHYGSAYCIYSLVLEGQRNKAGSIEQWNKCFDNANKSIPEERDWRNIAQQRLKINQKKL